MKLRAGLVSAVALLALVAGCGDTSDSTSGARLPDGFPLPDGAEIVGTVIPRLNGPNATGDPHRLTHSWHAVLRIPGNPEEVYDAYSAQAKTVGLEPFAPFSTSCDSGIPGTRCSGTSYTDDLSHRLSVMVNESTAWLAYTAPGSPTETTIRAVATSRGPGAPEREWWLVPGTRRLISTDLFECNGPLELLEVTGDADAAWKALRERSSWVENQNEIRGRVGNSEVRVLAGGGMDYSITLTLVEDPDAPHPVIAFEQCD